MHVEDNTGNLIVTSSLFEQLIQKEQRDWPNLLSHDRVRT